MNDPAINQTSLISDQDRLYRLAERCVMCGMCLQHCPTYLKTNNEGESPRGRISLILGLASEKLSPSKEMVQHLDSCLSCRACESICPSGVEYGKLIDMTRQHLSQWHPNIRKPNTKKQLLKKSLAHSGVLKLGGKLINLISISGINHVMNHSGIARLQQLQPNRSVTGKLKQHYPVPNEAIGRVALFTGCVSKALDKETLHASIVVLNHLGYEVTLPGKQTCCGAMHAHDGDYNDAVSLARKNIQAFDDTSVDAIITAATGCGAHLTEYHHLFNTENKDKPSADQFSAKVMDICHFINNAKWPKELKPRPLNKRVAVHEPCSLKNVLRQTDKVYKLLHKIPELELIPLPGNKHCCGAAGSYMLDHPEMADQLRQDKLDALLALKPDILVSSNIGCALHLAAGLRTQGLDIEVVHPITLLHRQLSA